MQVHVTLPTKPIIKSNPPNLLILKIMKYVNHSCFKECLHKIKILFKISFSFGL